MSDDAFKFQVDLRGIIRVLSESLYSSPQVFARELLQNATDAIAARRALGEPFEPRVEVELSGGGAAGPTMTMTDNGIGLTEEEVHRFLATIGSSSKRLATGRPSKDFIGAFGIGLLSCFMVADEIVLITRSARPGHNAFEWRGRADGTYTLRDLGPTFNPGTQLFLHAREDAAKWFEATKLRELLQYYGRLLPYPIRLGGAVINDEARPWRAEYRDDRARRKAYLDYGQAVFKERFLDAIELSGPGVEGLAFVMRQSPPPTHKPKHRIYLKGMLLTESGEGLVPDWAFFVRVLVDSTELTPAASREGLRDDERLAEAREAIGEALSAYLFDLAEHDPERLRQVVATHMTAIKSLAAGDDDALRAFIGYLPFETTLGTLTLPEALERGAAEIRYVASHDEFRQVAAVMAAQQSCVVDAGFAYDAELLERFGVMRPDVSVAAVEVTDLVGELEELSAAEERAVAEFERAADAALRRHRCRAIVRRFKPAELPALYSVDRAERFRRNVERTAADAGALWGDVLGGVGASAAAGAAGERGRSQLCFNYANPLVVRIASLPDGALRNHVIEMLYVQSLLLGHHPLGRDEMQLMNRGLLTLIGRAIGGDGS